MKKLFIVASAFFLTFAACKKDKKTDPEPIPTPVTPADPNASQKQQAKETYAKLAFAMYDDSYQGAINLKNKITAFLANRTSQNYTDCKTAWLSVRDIYGLTETFRFVDGPIDNPADGPEGFINAWPMDEAFVDYVVGSPTVGIINNATTYPTIDEATLLSANENGGEKNISLGFHAIEFLLWGQDLSATAAGMRPYTDYLITGGTAANQMRRAQYLSVTMDILIAGLKQVKDAWDPTISGNYRETFVGMDNNTAIRKMFNSLSVLAGTELSGERMQTAYDNSDQEDEHSCFSDNTHKDLYANAKGMEILFKGSYTRTNATVVSGYSLKDLSDLYDSSKSTDLVNAISNSITKIIAIPAPFDQAILGASPDRPKVLAGINALLDQDTKTKAIALALGIQL
ncbi:MAG: iron-regulated protein [Bacteroidetes bacterium]|nr:iron-regulated protein [Bacteroidota bacterium]